MTRNRDFKRQELGAPTEEMAAAVAEDTAALELEKLQRKLEREERKKRKEIEAESQKKAQWLLPSLLLLTVAIAWVFSHLSFQAN